MWKIPVILWLLTLLFWRMIIFMVKGMSPEDALIAKLTHKFPPVYIFMCLLWMGCGIAAIISTIIMIIKL